MNILILPSWYTTPENPTSGIFFKEQAQALQSYFDRFDIGSRVYVLAVETFSVRSIQQFVKRKRLKFSVEDGIPTLRTRFFYIPKVGKLNYLRCGKHVSSGIKKLQKRLNVQFDLIHIHSALEAGIWYYFSKLSIPYVITEHSSMYSRMLITKRQKSVLPKVFDNASKIIAVGNGLVSEITKYTEKKIEVIFNIVAPSFSYEIKGVMQNQKEFIFFSLGVNARTKGFDILLSAFQDFIKKGNRARLVIAGLLPEEKEWLLSLGISDATLKNVELLGKLNRDEVKLYMSSCNAFILVSRHETFGVVFAEAMYCGKPVIASKTGGPDSFVNSTTGIIVPVENVEKTD